jgi:nitroimidazol reductase NimA-like FMN-containing flavoprotein (pyridoxamine 5'-phosphate oxidase superfamily)
MRRKEREITDIHEKLAVIDRCKVCRIGLVDGDRPYIIPLNFGYAFLDNQLTLFFHSAREGKKIDLLHKNPNACFEIDCDHSLLEGGKPCEYGFAFSSVIGFGTIDFISAAEEKTFALNMLMKHQTGKNMQYGYTENELNGVTVYKLTVAEFTGKRH